MSRLAVVRPWPWETSSNSCSPSWSGSTPGSPEFLSTWRRRCEKGWMKFQLGPHLRVLVEAGLQHKPKTTKRTFRKSSAGKIRRRGERIQTAEQDLHPARNPNEAGPEKQFVPEIAPGRKTGIPNERKRNRGTALERKIANGKKTDLAHDPKTELGSGIKIDLGTGLEKKIGLKTGIANGEKIVRENGPEKETGPKITKGKKIDRGPVIEVKKTSQNIVIVVVPVIVEEEEDIVIAEGDRKIIQNMPSN